MTRRRDILILVGLFGVLVVFTILGPGQVEEDDPFAGVPTTYSSGPAGALALLRWTQTLGYDAQRLEFRAFELAPQDEALFILAPRERINRAQSAHVLAWVADGGTLILADERSLIFQGQNELYNDLDVTLESFGDDIIWASTTQPVFDQPPLDTAWVETRRVLATSRDDVAHLLIASTVPADADAEEDDAAAAADAETSASNSVLLGIAHGEGYIYLSSAVYPFTNAGLRDERNADLVLNLLQPVSPGGRILFDEYHHGYFTPPSLRSIVMSSPWGWAMLYSLGVVGCYMVLTGRRFGHPVPLREEVTRRSSAEYVASMADLFQRSGKRQYILRHYYTDFKRRLARPAGLNPGLDDALFLHEIGQYYRLDADAQQHLRSVLTRLQQPRPTEEEMLRSIADADALLATYATRKLWNA